MSTTAARTHSQLHNPRSTWFLGAPLSKCMAFMTVGMYILAERKRWHDAMVLDTTKIFDHAEFYRIFTCNLTFGSTGELLFGLAALCPLLRRFEREMGTRKFGAYIAYSSFLSTFLELLFFNIFFDTQRYCGPYPQLGAMLCLYHKYTPRLHPKFFGVLGLDFSEKALTYGLCFQVIFSGGFGTIIPTMFGFAAGMLCVTWSCRELPDFVYVAAGGVLGKFVVDDAPAVMMARSVQRSASGRARRGGRDVNTIARPAVRQQQQPPPPPSEEAIEQLTSMGFEREAVLRALQMSDNNVEAAANRLLAG